MDKDCARKIEGSTVFSQKTECRDDLSLEMIDYSFPSCGDSAVFRIYDGVEIGIVRKGEGIHGILEQSFPCSEGDMYIVAPGVPHSCYVSEKGGSLSLCRLRFPVDKWFKGEIAHTMSSNYCFGVFNFNASMAYAKPAQEVRDEVYLLIDRIQKELNAPGSYPRETIRSCLTLILVTISRYAESSITTAPAVTAITPKEQTRLTSIMRVISERYYEMDLTIEDVANSIYTSASVVSRCIRNHTGQTFSDYLREYRIEKACHLLLTTDESVPSIAQLCGLKDIPTFYRIFKNSKGITPIQYRKQIKRKNDASLRIEGKISAPDILGMIAESVQEGSYTVIERQIEEAISMGIHAENILNDGMIAGMNRVGEKFKNKIIYIPEVLLASKAMNIGIQRLKPHFPEAECRSVGRVCIGTVQGDLHDIGKNIVKTMMEGKRLEVIDLGTDVSPEAFVRTAKERHCQIICCSALLMTTMNGMADVVEEARKAGIRDSVKIMIGGAPITEEFCHKIGADLYTVDAEQAAEAAVRFCREAERDSRTDPSETEGPVSPR